VSSLLDTTIEDNDIDLAFQSSHRVLDEPEEEGELVGIILVVNSANIIPELKAYHGGGTPDNLNDIRIVDMLKYGMGMVPGDVDVLPSGRTQDHIGERDPVFMYIRRYKDDDLADYLGDTTRTYAVFYTPTTPYHYTGISFYIKNTSTADNAIIKQVIVRRRVTAARLEAEATTDETDEEETVDEGDMSQVPTYPATPNIDYTWRPPEMIVPTQEYSEEF
jgi:hypothetical protein